MGRRKVESKREGEGGGSKRRRANRKEMVEGTEEKSSGGGDATISEPEPTSGGDGVHPLTIDHIVEKIFEHIIVLRPRACSLDQEGSAESSSSEVAKTVQALRLVCRQWKAIATRLYRRRRVPMITFGNFNPLWKSDWSRARDERMQSFVDVMKSSDLSPIQRYKICPSIFTKENEQLMKDFMRICGPDALELNFHCSNSNTMRFSRRIFPDLNLAMLYKLKFVFTNSPRHQRKYLTSQIYELTYLLEVLLGAAKTLGIVVLTFLDFWRKWEWSQAMAKRFEEIVSTRIPKTVKMLILDTPLSDSHLNTLMERELQLKAFGFDWQCGVSRSAMGQFFKRQAPTLKLLTMYDRFPTRSSSVSFDFPRFDELCHLELVGGTIRQVSFQETFPKLITLDISEWQSESTCIEFLGSAKKGFSLKELHFPYYFEMASLVKHAARCFPNINKLLIGPAPDILEALQEIFIYFENIEELYLSFPDIEVNIDSLFSGVSKNECQRIKDGLNFDDVDLEDLQYRPSILNLTKLKKLALGVAGGADFILTDFAVHFVFLKMDSLKELLTKGFQMNTNCVDLLSEKLSLKAY